MSLQYNLMHPDAPPAPITQAEYDAGKAWLTELSNVFATKNLSALSNFFTEDVAITLANQTQVQGFGKVIDIFAWQNTALASWESSVEFILVLKEGIISQTVLTYNFTNGETKSTRSIVVIAKKSTEDKATGYHLHGDFSEASNILLKLAGNPPALA